MRRDLPPATDATTRSVAVVRAAGAGPQQLRAIVAEVAAAAIGCVRIVVAAEGEPLAAGESRAAAGRIPVSFAGEGRWLDAAREAAHEHGAAGIVVVGAGGLPRAFDARLARIAVDSPSIATVSPFCDASAAHRLREPTDLAPLSSEEAARLDRLAFLRGARSYYGVDAPLEQCCFIPVAALAELGGTLDGVTFATCVDRISRKGFEHVLADSVYVNAAAAEPAAPRAPEPPQLAASREAILEAWHSGLDFAALPGVDARPVQLHVVHDLGGGTEKWLRDFSGADSSRINMVLKSITVDDAMGTGLALYTDVTDAAPLATWRLARPIAATVPVDAEYRRILDETVARHCVDVLVVSSLIGHSLDALDTGLPTLVVTHDYYPYCPAINLYFDGVCQKCDEKRIEECYHGNPKFNPFVKLVPAERVAVRGRYLRLVERKGVTLVTPSRSVAENLKRIEPRFSGVAIETIPHGYGDPLPRVEAGADRERLRIVVLGQLAVLKGSDLLRDALAAITQFADVWLLGPREVGETFRDEPGVHIVDQYDVEHLPQHIAAISPHLGLLTSIAPETFNYALTELQMLGVPTAATRVGAFVERIRHAETGYLFDPDVRSMVSLLRAIERDRDTLARIRAALPSLAQRSAADMVADYHAIAPVVTASAARYPLGSATPAAGGLAASANALASQQMTLAAMWKEMRSLHLRLTLTERTMVDERAQAKATIATLKRTVAEAQEKQARQSTQLADAERRLEAMQIEIDAKTSRIDGLLASTSWRISAPVRALGHALRWGRKIAEVLGIMVRDPASVPEIARALRRAWRLGGMTQLKQALQDVEAAQDPDDLFAQYQRAFRRKVRPLILERIANMEERPLISVLVPTYNPPNPDMFRQMLDSVVGQLYPYWELCVVDDGSTQPWVFSMLRDYAARHSRIKLDLGGKNRGVSAALNRALEMASADFVVLLDHDDILEPQALFRFAECVIEDRADMAYGDEVLVAADGNEVRRYAYRPAFSLEHLRGHPYIVHPIGFRARFLRDIGGFDESLRISQDYDLILRAAEKANAIVHIPEILYRWRIHGSSAGISKREEVMETSRKVIDAHLARCGEKGHTRHGVSFNLFDVRYPLQPGLKVAIVIPTKNHGELLRQCIESLWNTIGGDVACEIVVVDHESDDPETLAYLESIAKVITIVPYKGKFNFSAINNRAVAALDESFTHVLFCNNDIEAYQPGWLERMLELGQQPSIAAVGAKLFYPDRRTIQHAGVCIGAFGAAEHYGKRVSEPGSQVAHGFSELLDINHEVAAVTAACMLMRLDVFREVGGFDETIEVGFGDVDLCLRAWQRGYRILFCPYAALVHHESFTRGTSDGRDPHPHDSAIYLTKWKSLLRAGDPYYSPGLSQVSTTWAVKQPLHCSYEIRRRIVRWDRAAGREAVTFSAPEAE